ncbi:MAG: hypothetical protein NT154_03915 [Verrucomicrobia bacterium]|nr:hypothetical protein [Verrucomicrobiota bacterium]
MSCKLRIEYPGAMYHVMTREDQREDILRDDEDRQQFLSTVREGGSISNPLNEPPESQPREKDVLRLCQ